MKAALNSPPDGLGRAVTVAWDKSELRSRLGGVKLARDTVLVDLQQLARERPVEAEPRRRFRIRR